MASAMQIGALADLVEGRARRMWPGRWPARPPMATEDAAADADRGRVHEGLAAQLAALDEADWAPLLEAVARRQVEQDACLV
jgi:hypothetical protein